MGEIPGRVLRLLASLKAAISLLVVLSVVLAVATVLESIHGRLWAQWFCYTSWWFIALLAALAVNISAATLIRFRWKWHRVAFLAIQAVLFGVMYCYPTWLIIVLLSVLALLILAAVLICFPSDAHQLGFVITHIGVLALLGGALQTYKLGIEGQLAFLEGEQKDSITIIDRSQLVIFKRGSTDVEEVLKVSFRGGPVDWSDKKTIDFGEAHGIGVKALKYYPHAERVVSWVEDESGAGQTALQLALLAPDGKPVEQKWLPANRYGGEIRIGSTRFRSLPATSDTLVEDFLQPPETDKDSIGILSMHYEGKMHRVAVRENLGKKVPLGESGVEVELVEYLPDAMGGAGGRFASRSDKPRNPFLELLVHLPNKEQPARQITFSNRPFLNLDGVSGRRLPVKFWYHHPAAARQPGAEFMQTPDGKLFCRAITKNATLSRGEVEPGDKIDIDAGFKVSLIEFLPRARQEVIFRPIEVEGDESQGGDAAALFEVDVAGVKQQVWLKRNDQQFGFQWIKTAKDPLQLVFRNELVSLGYWLKLHDFTRGMDVGGMGDASFSSLVQLIDDSEKIRPEEVDERHEISMNHPLTHGKFTFYQSSYRQLPDGREASFLSAAYDPGRFLKYFGSIVLCVGIFVVFYVGPLLKGWLRVPRRTPSLR